MTRPAPIQRFFGELPASADPFDLLGIDPDACTDDAVHAALRRRLERLSAHPQSRSPEADEVRLALHVAGAQLLDARVRAELIHDRRLARSRVAASQGDASPRQATPRSPFEDAALWAIASAGGWNAIAKRRLGALAHAYQVSTSELASAVAHVGQRAAIDRTRAPRLTPRRMVASTAQILDNRAALSRHRARRLAALQRWGSLALLIILIAANAFIMRRLVIIKGNLDARAGRDQSVADPSLESTTPPPRIIVPVDPGSPPQAGSQAVDPEWRDDEPIEMAKPPPAGSRAADSGVIDRWAAAALLILRSDNDRSRSPLHRLASAVQLAYMNLAAECLWAGDAAGADSAAQQALAPIPPPPPRPLERFEDPGMLTAPGGDGDGALALDLLSLRRRPAQGVDAFRYKRFTNLRFGPVDCDVAAETALIGSPQELRLVARRMVVDQAENPAMINALLESLPRAGRQSAVSSLIQEVTDRPLPPTDDPSWPSRVRAALIERLAELLAPGILPGVDELARRLGDAYAAASAAGAGNDGRALPALRSDPAPIGEPVTRADSPDSSLAGSGVLAASESLRARWLDEASRHRASRSFAEGLGRVERAAGTRLLLSRGEIQKVVAAQATVAELMALVIAHERPSQAAASERIIAECVSARRAADHVFAQIEAVERARLRLWLLRLAAADSSEAP